MYHDAKVTLYGATVIGLALVAIGLGTKSVIASTGFAIMLGGTIVALALDYLAESDADAPAE